MSISHSVKRLQDIKFCTGSLTSQRKIYIKLAGSSTINLKITQTAKSLGKTNTRQFNANSYQRCEWICECEYTNGVFCFPCLLFGFDNGDTAWTKIGHSLLKNNFQKKIRKHDCTRNLLGILTVPSIYLILGWPLLQ